MSQPYENQPEQNPAGGPGYPGYPGYPSYPGGLPGYPSGPGGYPPVGYQPAGPPNLAGPGKRFGAFLLSIVLTLVTLGIGWVIWSLVVYQDGRTPSYQLLGMRIVDGNTGRPLNWGQSFLRNFVVYGLLGAIPILGYVYRLVGACFVFGDDRRALWDKMVNCYVVND